MLEIVLWGLYESLNAPERTGGLTNLRTLKNVAIDSKFARYLANLMQLRSLNIELKTDVDGEVFCASIHKMKLLRSLDILPIPGSFRGEGIIIVSPNEDSSETTSLGKTREATKSNLLFSEGGSIWYLSNFAQSHAYLGERIGECSAEGFPKLQYLLLSKLTDLREWGEVEKGALPNLHGVRMFIYKNLKALPEGFQYLSSLQTLQLDFMSDEFVNRLKNEDHYKVQHMPVVRHDYYEVEEGEWKAEIL
ncbi:hypothetical protein AMTR_s00006p00263900 [Amborella trichopoda]|uniref:NB-ARC domain-containing protein n=1 Tax=Amborella trichopoda TaxID=13333 RepID=W1PFL9_AMBTC|nr:hypothetical protein AMTR_s00006p00263900 [Amborella trichopoda]